MIKQKKKGITLVALVVTIIVLLMLVGITIGAIFGGDGTLSKAHETKVASRASIIKDRLTVKHSGDKVKRKVGDKIESLDDFITNLKTEGLILDSEEVENYKLTLGTETIDFLGPNPYVYIEVGDIVYYDPTKDANPSKLTYTSPKGLSKAVGDANNVSGNGYGEQVFQATSADNKWVVLYNKNNQLTLMSYDLKDPISGGYNGNLGIKGTIGHLYQEQELNNICSIYGYGKGAVSQVLYLKQPQIGSPNVQGDLKGANLLKSGARSLSMDDIEEITEIKTKEDKMEAHRLIKEQLGDMESYNNDFRDFFMNNIRPDVEIQIPTLSGVVLGKPIYTFYAIHNTDPHVPDLLREHIFKDKYWIIGRVNFSETDRTRYRLRNIDTSGVHAFAVSAGLASSLGSGSYNASVRPVVQLQTGIEMNLSTKDGYKWEVNQD